MGEVNEYLLGNKEFVLDVSDGQWSVLPGHQFSAELIHDNLPLWMLKWDSVRVEMNWVSANPIRGESTDRSLIALRIHGLEKKQTQCLILLPGSEGIVSFLEGYPRDEYAFTVGYFGSTDKLRIQLPPLVAMTSADWKNEGTSPKHVIPAQWSAQLAKTSRPHVVLATGETDSAANRIAYQYRDFSRKDLERILLDSIRSKLAFSFNTENDTVNRAFALLAATLIQAEPQPDLQTRQDLENAAQMSRGLWLIMRAQPEIVFGNLAKTFTEDERIRWGHASYEAALAYGMSDSLRELMYFVLSGLSRLHAEYVSTSPEILGDELAPDSMTTLAVAQIRYASLMNFGERLCASRLDAKGQDVYRADGLRAMKAARKIYEQAWDRFEVLKTLPEERSLETFFDTSQVEVEREFEVNEISPPDSAAYMRSGANYGFEWLSGRPRELVDDENTLDGFSRLRWNEFRFRDSLKLMETSALDSMFSLLLNGPTPGTLAEFPEQGGEVSWLVMSELVRALAELYLGVQPNMLEKKVSIEPRVPASWGRTLARVPLGTGYLHVDYDFGNSRAEVWTTGISDSLNITFGFPFRTGGFSRAQFALTQNEPRAEIVAEVDSGNRLHLRVDQ